MIQILPLADMMHEEVLLEDDFASKFEGWELIEDEEEKSFIKDSHYWMENKSKTRWMFYHKKLPVSSKENFIIKAEIELLNSNNDYVNFEIEILTTDQINDYKKQHPEELSASFNKMQVLKSMLDAGLITLQSIQ